MSFLKKVLAVAIHLGQDLFSSLVWYVGFGCSILASLMMLAPAIFNEEGRAFIRENPFTFYSIFAAAAVTSLALYFLHLHLRRRWPHVSHL